MEKYKNIYWGNKRGPSNFCKVVMKTKRRCLGHFSAGNNISLESHTVGEKSLRCRMLFGLAFYSPSCFRLFCSSNSSIAVKVSISIGTSFTEGPWTVSTEFFSLLSSMTKLNCIYQLLSLFI